jgi:hypothetical protein
VAPNMGQTYFERLNEAEQYHLKAQSILHEIQNKNKVFGSNPSTSLAKINQALKYIARSLEFFPENENYLNIKALLLWEARKRKWQQKSAAVLQKEPALRQSDNVVKDKVKSVTVSNIALGLDLKQVFSILFEVLVILLKWFFNSSLNDLFLAFIGFFGFIIFARVVWLIFWL